MTRLNGRVRSNINQARKAEENNGVLDILFFCSLDKRIKNVSKSRDSSIKQSYCNIIWRVQLRNSRPFFPAISSNSSLKTLQLAVSLVYQD
jgi:hypothetical protein